MASFWSTTISLANVGASRTDFGNLLVVGFMQRITDVIGEYSTSSEMSTAGYRPTDAEMLAAQKIEAQEQRVSSFKVGRRQLPPTMAVTLTPTALNSKIYRVLVNNTAAEYTSDATATVAEITAGLKIAIDALAPAAWAPSTTYTAGQTRTNDSGKIYKVTTGGVSAGSGGPTGAAVAITDNTVVWEMIGVVPTVTDATTHLTIVSPVAGQNVFVSIDGSPAYAGHAGLSLTYDHADPGIATDLSAMLAADADWYAFSIIGASEAEVASAAAWAASNHKLYVQASSQSALINNASNLAATLTLADNPRTSIIYRADQRDMYEFGLMGKQLSRLAGSGNWAYVTVQGSLPDYLTTAHISNLNASRCNYVENRKGITGFFEGMTCSSNMWLDIVRGRDWFVDELDANLYEMQVNAANSSIGKIPYTDAGISSVKSAIRQTGESGVNRNFLVAGTLNISVPEAADIPAATRATRRLSGIIVQATLVGAINGGSVTVTLT